MELCSENNRGPANIPFETGPTADRMNFQYDPKLLSAFTVRKPEEVRKLPVKIRKNVRDILINSRLAFPLSFKFSSKQEINRNNMSNELNVSIGQVIVI